MWYIDENADMVCSVGAEAGTAEALHALKGQIGLSQSLHPPREKRSSEAEALSGYEEHRATSEEARQERTSRLML